MKDGEAYFCSLALSSPSSHQLVFLQTGPSLVQPSTLCRKRPRSDRSKVTSGALEKEDQGLKSNPFGQKRVKTSAASFFTDSSSKSALKKSKFDTTKVTGSKAKKEKEKVKLPPPALEEKKISKAEKSKRKVFDEDSDEEDDDGTGFLDVSADSSKKASKPSKGAVDDDDNFEGDESSDDEHEKVAPKKKVEEEEETAPEPTKPKEKVYGAMDGFAIAPKQTAAVGEVVNGKRRVTKKRFVEREEMDDKGYMHTTTVEETYEEWEVVEEVKEKMPVRSGAKGGGKKVGKVQKGLMGFFAKK